MTKAEIKPFDLASIKPPHGQMDGSGKFSPNLYRWMKAQSEYRRARIGLWKDPHGVYRLGLVSEEGWFIGAPLRHALTRGARTELYSYMKADSKDFREIKTFWPRYKKLGRCAIDAKHSKYWENDDARWTVTRNMRSCNWCGKHKQRRIVKTEVRRERIETWVSA